MVTPMAENRTPRDMETRDAASRPKSWAPPSLLPEVNQEPGYSYRWIRISTLGTPDVNNISSKFREGWEPVKASEHPEAFSMADPNSRFKDAIESGGLILCKTPVEFTQQRDAHYRKQTEDQVASVDNNFMRENDPRMPLFKEKRSTVTFGSGSK
jgi:hypothetical protein